MFFISEPIFQIFDSSRILGDSVKVQPTTGGVVAGRANDDQLCQHGVVGDREVFRP